MSWFRHHRPDRSEQRGRVRRLAALAGLAVAAVALPGAVSTATVAAAKTEPPLVDLDPRLVQIVSPVSDSLVTAPRARLVVRVARPVRELSASVRRRPISLRRVGTDRYVGFASGLRQGRNVVSVDAVARDGRKGSALVPVTFALRRPELIRLQAPLRSASPVSVAVRVPLDEVSFRAWLNGKRLGSRFYPTVRGVRRASLSASDHLRYGRNRLRVEVVGDSRLRDRAVYDVAVRSFFVPRSRPLVGAGVDRRIRAGTRVRLDGRASRPHARGGQLRYRWRLVRRPAGSRARLLSTTTARPRLVTDKRGRYRIALVTRTSRTALGGSPAAPGTVVSRPDDVIVDANWSFPLIRLRTNIPMGTNCYGITVGPDQSGLQPDRYPNPSCGTNPGIHVLTLARGTLDRVDEKSFVNPADLLTYVNGLPSTAGAAPLVVINADAAYTAVAGNASVFGNASFNQAIQKLGAWGYPSGLEIQPSSQGGALIVGVPGWQRGAGFQSASPGYVAPSGLTGFFIEDQTNVYRFQAQDGQAQYQTAYGSSGGAGQMEIAGKTYSMTPATDPEFSAGMPAWSTADPYVHLVAVRADAPFVGSPSTGYKPLERAFAVDTIQCVSAEQSPTPGCTFDKELARMRDGLIKLVGDRSVLVFAQTVGSVYRFPGNANAPASDGWYEVGDMLGQLGGSAWVWDNMATAPGQAGNQNAYALVGGQAIADESRLEGTEIGGQIPDAWTGEAGPHFQQGVLALNNLGWFTPVHGLPTYLNTPAAGFGSSLPEIVFGPPQPWPYMDTSGGVAAYNWINKDPNLNFTGDLHTDYYTARENAPWGTVQKHLGDLPYESGNGFTEAEFEAVKAGLDRELDWVQNVTTWIEAVTKPLTIQGTTNWITVNQFGDDVTKALNPPQSGTAQWASFAFSLLGDLAGFGGIFEGDIGKAFVIGAQTLATSSALASGADSGEPITGDLQAQLDHLSMTLDNNAKATFNSIARVREIILSDYGKLSQIGTKTKIGADWDFGVNSFNDSVNHLHAGVVRQAYQAILPAMGAVLQVWPATGWSHNNHSVKQATGIACPDGWYYFSSYGSWHAEPESAAPRLSLWYENYQGKTAQTQPPWTFLVYRLRLENFAHGEAPPAAMTDPLSVAPAPNGQFTTDPKTKLPGPGFYMPWLFSRAFEPIQWNCQE